MTTQHALAPAHAAMPKGPEGGGGDGDGGGGDGDGKDGGGEEVAPITRHITQNWRSPSILSRVADMVQAQCPGAVPGKLESRDGSICSSVSVTSVSFVAV